MKHIMLLLVIFLFGCSTTNNKIQDKAERISMITLIANPEKYHKRKVQIQGYFKLQKEEYAIYNSKADFESGIFKNGVWLSVSKDFVSSQYIDEPYQGYIYIEGVFNKDKLGIYNLYSGTLEEINSISRMFRRDGETGSEHNMD